MAYFYKREKQIVHHPLFPENFRMLIVGPSESGKTSLLMRMLLEDGLINYQKLFVFARSLYQNEYQVLKAGLENGLPKKEIVKLMNADDLLKKYKTTIDDIATKLSEILQLDDSIECEFHDAPDNIPDPSSIDKSLRNLIVFDDVMTDKKQTPAENYYTRGRTANCDCIYLSQNYTHLPLHTIRSNSNFMIFFKSSPLVVDQLHRTFASVDMDYVDFKKLCKEAWKNKFGFLVIDLSRDFESGNKYRRQLELN